MRVAWLAMLLSLLSIASARADGDDTWLVAIGNNYGDRSETGLLFAERDAREVAEALRIYGGVSSRRTTLVLGEQVEAVRRALIDVNAEIRAAVAEGRPTTLIVFYSGHADADSLHFDGSRLRFDELRKLVTGSAATMRMLFVDACRSGSVTRVKGVTPAQPFAITMDDHTAAEGTAIITSSAAGESSQESDSLRGSFFTHHFINALRGAADRDADGVVTLNEAYAYTYAQTLNSTGRTIALQHPTYAYDVKGRAPVVLSRPGAASNQTGHLRLGRAATYLITQSKVGGPMVAELSPDNDGVRVALPTGQYLVQQRLPAEYREYRVALAQGSDVELVRLPYESAKYDRLVRTRGGPRDLTHGVMLLGGVRGEIVNGEGVTPHLVLGYGVDFPWSTAGLRLRYSRVDSEADNRVTRGHHDELGLGLSFARVVDLRYFSAGFGVTIEGALHHQTRKGASQSTVRNAWGFNFGAVASVERHLFYGVALHLEGGPMTALYRSATTTFGEEKGSELSSKLTYWAAGGLVWRR